MWLSFENWVRIEKLIRYQSLDILAFALPLHEKCPNIEFFLIRIFSHSDWIQRDTEHVSLFSLNARKCGPEKPPYLDTFHAVYIYNMIVNPFPFRKQYSWSFFLRPYSPLWSHSSSQRSAVILPPIWKKCLFYFVDFPKFFLIVNQL